MSFMQRVATQSVIVSDDFLKPAVKDIEHYLRKMYEEDPKRDFTMRMSSIGRPLCQLQMDKAQAIAMQDEWNNPLRMFFGGVIEATAICILRASGITIEAEQVKVELPVPLTKGKKDEIIKIKGTLDVIIDGKVWDIKSASSYMFANKFSSYANLKDNDDFGYVTQLFGYAEAVCMPAGGWIVVDKSSGLIKVVEIPDSAYEWDRNYYLQAITDNVNALVNNVKFQRQYEDIDETFKKRYTGNKYLKSPCEFCKYRYTCWPGLEYLPVQESTAFDKPYRHYTKLGVRDLKNDEDTISESKGTETTEVREATNLGEILDTLGA